MRLTRIFIVGLFIPLFAFGIQTHAYAQAVDPTCAGSPSPDVCTQCKASSTYFQQHYEQCRIAVSGYNTSVNLPQEVPPYISGVAASKGVNTCVSKTTTQNGTMVKMNKMAYDNLSIGNLLADPVCRIGGCGCTLNGIVYMGPPPANEQVAYNQNGIMNSMINATSAIAVLPVSSSDYVADVIQTIQNPLGAQQAYAQGLGFSSLKPVLGLWKLFRNVAYFFFVIIFIIIGFLIMFRSKIGGQAAVTVQQALPKIIVALLLVTFSYAIAGFMIDLMYLLIYLMIGIFSADGTLRSADLVKIAFSNHLFNNISQIISGGVVSTIGGSIGNAVSSMLVDSGWAQATASFAGLGANIIFTLVMLVALLVNMFRLFFALLQAYVMVLFSVVFAPIQLMMGALPGQNTFGAWLKGLLSNLMAFPVVIFFLLCAQYFTVTKFGTDGTGGFAAPQLGLQSGGGSGVFILAILQFGILALIPKAIEIAKGAVNGKLDIDPGKAMGEFYKSGKLGQTIGTGLIGGAVGGIAGTAIGGAIGYGTGTGSFSDRMKRAKSGAAIGLGAGVLSPIIAPSAYTTGKQVVRGGFNQAMQAVGGRAYNEGRIELNKRGWTLENLLNGKGKGSPGSTPSPVPPSGSGSSTASSAPAGSTPKTSSGASTNDGGYGDN